MLPTTGPAQESDKAPLPKIQIAPDGRTFTMADGKPFVPMGVNYFRPGTGWSPQLWKRFDAEAVRQDLALLKAHGVNCIRVFLSHGSFFWDTETLMPEGLEKFDQLLTLAEEAGIYVHPSGPDYWEGRPDWTGDRIADEQALVAIESFWRQFAARYRGRSVIFSYDLLNEPFAPFESKAAEAKWNAWLAEQYGSAAKQAESWGVAPEGIRWGQQAMPPLKDAPGDRQLLDFQHFREQLADDWTRRQAVAIKSADPQALVTVGMLQYAVPTQLCSVRYYAAYRPERQAKYLDYLEVHLYPLSMAMHEYTEENVLHHLAYLQSVVREMAKPGKPVVVGEFGWYGGGKLDLKDQNYGFVSEEQQAEWNCRLIGTTRGFTTGWLNWACFDHPEALDCTRLSGLFLADGTPKAWARAFHRLAGSFSGVTTPPAAIGPRPTLDWEACLTDSAVGRRFGEEYERAYRAEQSR